MLLLQHDMCLLFGRAGDPEFGNTVSHRRTSLQHTHTLTAVTLLHEALAVLEGLLPQALFGGQQATGGRRGRDHGHHRAVHLRPIIYGDVARCVSLVLL